jgi:mRNA deadenylase 3'-5' endonuclease subunit Ccr4
MQLSPKVAGKIVELTGIFMQQIAFIMSDFDTEPRDTLYQTLCDFIADQVTQALNGMQSGSGGSGT